MQQAKRAVNHNASEKTRGRSGFPVYVLIFATFCLGECSQSADLSIAEYVLRSLKVLCHLLWHLPEWQQTTTMRLTQVQVKGKLILRLAEL